MATLYPASLDAFENPAGDTSQAQIRTHSQQHSDANDAIEAVQAKVGIDGSQDPATLDYKVRELRVGGWRSVATIEDRDAIPADQLVLGMIVAVTDDEEAGNNIQWQLTGFGGDGAPIWTDMAAPTNAKLSALQANVDFELQAMQASVDATEADLNERMDDVIAGQSTSALYADTLTDLQATPGAFEGQGGFVVNGTGTGQYRWDGSAWQFLRADTLASKADIAYVNDKLADVPKVVQLTSLGDKLVLVDSAGNKAWIEVELGTGLPTQRTADLLRPLLGFDAAIADLPRLVEMAAVGNKLVMTDELGNSAWPEIELGTGRPTDRTAYALANVLHYYVGETQPPVWPGNWLIWVQVDSTHLPIQTYLVEG